MKFCPIPGCSVEISDRRSICKRCYFRLYMQEKRAAGVVKKYPKDKKRAAEVQKAYHSRNRDEINARKKEWRNRPENRKKELSYSKKYDRSEARKLSKEKYRLTEKYKLKQKRYFNKLRAATVPWSQTTTIKRFYRNCPDGFSVDHILPLNGESVSGLHVIENLQYLPRSVNSRKRNELQG